MKIPKNSNFIKLLLLITFLIKSISSSIKISHPIELADKFPGKKIIKNLKHLLNKLKKKKN